MHVFRQEKRWPLHYSTFAFPLLRLLAAGFLGLSRRLSCVPIVRFGYQIRHDPRLCPILPTREANLVKTLLQHLFPSLDHYKGILNIDLNTKPRNFPLLTKLVALSTQRKDDPCSGQFQLAYSQYSMGSSGSLTQTTTELKEASKALKLGFHFLMVMKL